MNVIESIELTLKQLKQERENLILQELRPPIMAMGTAEYIKRLKADIELVKQKERKE